jgi:hypothetical protein
VFERVHTQVVAAADLRMMSGMMTHGSAPGPAVGSSTALTCTPDPRLALLEFEWTCGGDVTRISIQTLDDGDIALCEALRLEPTFDGSETELRCASRELMHAIARIHVNTPIHLELEQTKDAGVRVTTLDVDHSAMHGLIGTIHIGSTSGSSSATPPNGTVRDDARRCSSRIRLTLGDARWTLFKRMASDGAVFFIFREQLVAVLHMANGGSRIAAWGAAEHSRI